ncbi:MAG TPA: right-handed parallel beta-helix repeat-containing protein [Candidatus Bathyarchaeia archaeon]|nr:right-handed parallel beta-helix repeat-containing protein [Candidatus Bathyarchaeia archaeon]
MDQGVAAPTVFEFAPGEYMLTGAEGLRVPSGATLLMEGARFVLAETLDKDGQAFLLENVWHVLIQGGEIVGQRQAWSDGVNVAGVRMLGGGDLRVYGLTCRNLSSNAVGVFGASDEAPVRNVTLSGVTGINCCNAYMDYLQPNKGPAPGSDRRDQGTAAFYNVDGWTVEGSRFEGSRSDGTHFYHCRNGMFANSSVTGSQMGGYFLEGCENVVASGNLISGNGSRGCTIERDSRFCTLTGNVVTLSGREGLWMPDVSGIVVTSNIFRENGQKDDADKDCEIRLDEGEEYKTQTSGIRIESNLLHTRPNQTAAIYLSEGVEDVAVNNNTFTGGAPNEKREERRPAGG